MLKNIKPSFRKICYNFIIGAFFCTSFVSVANADICFVLDQDCIDGGALNRMTQENEVCSGYDETYDISTSSNGLKCDSCNKGSMVKYKCYCKEDNLVRKGDRCVYKSDSVCPIADYYFDADRGAGWDCDACIDHKSEQYGKYKCNCDGDHLYKNGTCVEDACLFLKGKSPLVSNSTASSRESQNWDCQKCTASSNETKYYNKAHCECDGEAWGEYCIPAGRCVASQGYYNTSNIQCGTGDVVKRMDSGHYKGCYYCADDDSDKCPSPYTKRQEEACRGKNGWYTIETDVTSTKGYPCFTCRQYQCNEEEGYYYFESQCKKHYNISWMNNFDRMWAAVVNNLIPIKDALAAVSQNAISAQDLQLVNDGGSGYMVAVGGGTGGRDCPCPKSGPGSGQYYGQDSSGRSTYYDISPCCMAIADQPITDDGLRPFVDSILDNERVLDEVIYREYRCFEDSTTKCWYGRIVDTDVCPEGTNFYSKLTCGSNEDKVDSGETSAKSHTKCYRCQRRVYVYNAATETCAPYLYLRKSDGTTINIGTAQTQTLIEPGTYTVGFALSTGVMNTLKIEGGTGAAVTFDAVVPSGASQKDVGSYNFADTAGTEYPPTYRMTPDCSADCTGCDYCITGRCSSSGDKSITSNSSTYEACPISCGNSQKYRCREGYTPVYRGSNQYSCEDRRNCYSNFQAQCNAWSGTMRSSSSQITSTNCRLSLGWCNNTYYYCQKSGCSDSGSSGGQCLSWLPNRYTNIPISKTVCTDVCCSEGAQQPLSYSYMTGCSPIGSTYTCQYEYHNAQVSFKLCYRSVSGMLYETEAEGQSMESGRFCVPGWIRVPHYTRCFGWYMVGCAGG